MIQILRKMQLQKWVLTADLRERFAECAENAANSSDSESVFGDSIHRHLVLWRRCRRRRRSAISPFCVGTYGLCLKC